MKYKRLGDLLLAAGMITESDLEEALKIQKERKDRLGKVLIDEGYITETQLIDALCMQLGIDFIDLSKIVIEPEMVEQLKLEGWKIVNNAFGECLLMPQESREKIIPAIADAIIDWHITSNQARTFSLMETLAIAVSDNANTLAGAIRAKLIDDNDEKPKAKPIIDENAGANTYVTLSCANYVMIESESSDALEKAKQDLIKRMMDFDYENQL